MAHHAIGAALLGAGAGAGVIDAVYLAVPEGRSSTSAWVGIASLATAGGGIALLVKDEPPGHHLSAWNWVGTVAATIGGVVLSAMVNGVAAAENNLTGFGDVAAGEVTPSRRMVERAAPAMQLSAAGIL